LGKWCCQTAIVYFVLIFYHCLSYNLNKNRMCVISSFIKNLFCTLNLRWKSLLWISVYVTFLCQTVIKFLQCRSTLSGSTFLTQTTNDKMTTLWINLNLRFLRNIPVKFGSTSLSSLTEEDQNVRSYWKTDAKLSHLLQLRFLPYLHFVPR
jgi:hypothetical protein